MPRSITVAAMIMMACTSSTERPAEVAPEPEPEAESKRAPTFENSVGAMSQHDVERAFGKFNRVVSRCVSEGTSRVSSIGGTFTLALRIGPDGAAKTVHLSASTLGDRDTEQCILTAAKTKRWPKAKGGIGEASHVYVVDPSEGVTEWKSGRLKPVMSEIHKKVAKCVMPLKGKWQATIYIKRNGRVATSGVAPPNAESEDQADCLVKVLNRFRFGPQRSKMSKVSFTIP